MEESKKIIIGSESQIGQEFNNFADDYILLNKEQLNILNFELLESIINKYKPKFILNFAAYTDVNNCEIEPNYAYAINSDGPKNLAILSAKYNFKLIHISTDYVFDGQSKKPYSELEKTNPINIYGKSKLLGENNIINNTDNYIIIRTSWLYSMFKTNFVLKIIKKLKSHQNFNVVIDEISSPTYTYNFSLVLNSITKITNFSNGIYHWSDKKYCSRFKFAKIIQEMCLEKKIINYESEISPSKQDNLRPKFSALSSIKLMKEIKLRNNNFDKNLNIMLNKYQNLK